MRRIASINVDDSQLFDDIAEAKYQPRRALLKAVRADVLDAYEEYLANAPGLEALVSISLEADEAEALKHGFLVETEPLAKLRTDLLSQVNAARCPLCGISESSTLDHYLPKEKFPEFSFFSKNLVPSCAWCNTKKRDKVLDKGTDARLFLHAYFDIVPNIQFLDCSVELQNGALLIDFKLQRPVGLAKKDFLHLKTHFRELGLKDRFRAMSLEHLSGQYGTFRRLYGADAKAKRVADRLLEQAEDWDLTYGPNFWTTRLYIALSDCNEFCDGGFESMKPL